eukprot:scaffold3456_cov101-Isochrysis_galbana.AAC.1
MVGRAGGQRGLNRLCRSALTRPGSIFGPCSIFGARRALFLGVLGAPGAVPPAAATAAARALPA